MPDGGVTYKQDYSDVARGCSTTSLNHPSDPVRLLRDTEDTCPTVSVSLTGNGKIPTVPTHQRTSWQTTGNIPQVGRHSHYLRLYYLLSQTAVNNLFPFYLTDFFPTHRLVMNYITMQSVLHNTLRHQPIPQTFWEHRR